MVRATFSGFNTALSALQANQKLKCYTNVVTVVANKI